jgi:beta-lactamase class A
VKRLSFESKGDVVFLLTLCGIMVLIVCLQQLFPTHTLIPFATIDGRLKRISSKNSIVAPYKAIEDKKITLKIADKLFAYRTGDLGVSLNEDATLRPFYVQSRLRRLIPFSMLAQIFQHQVPVYYSSQKGLNIVTSSIADGINTDPINAAIHVNQSSVTISPSENGRRFEPKLATIAIFDAITSQKDSVELKSKELLPDISTSKLEQAVVKFTNTLPSAITISVDGQDRSLEKQTMLTWMTYKVIDGSLAITFDDAKVQAYADFVAASLANANPPTPTLVSLTDGQETGRIPGTAGKSIDGSNLKNQITSAIASNNTQLTATLIDVVSPVKYTRSYTKSSAGLQELIDQITTNKSISIRYIDINERAWDVGSNAHQKTTMASTYKLFVGYSILKRIDEGKLQFSNMINGTTIDDCMHKMIINSDNECAVAMGERVGWNNIVADGKDIGATDLDWTDDAHGSVSDCATLLSKLSREEILSKVSRDYYIDLMRNQIYRQGIPSGTRFDVADKVGFLDSQLNDAAIIYAPDLTHVLVIYTNNESWTTIAEITRQIESLAL